MLAAGTIPVLFRNRVAQSGDQPALFFKKGDAFQSVTWNELARDVRRMAVGLIQNGISPGDRVILFSENRYEWIVTDLAIQLAQGVHVPVHAPLTGKQAAYQIAHSSAKVVVISTLQQAEKFADVEGNWLANPKLFSFDSNISKVVGRPVQSWTTLGADSSEAEQLAVEENAVKNVRSESLATILYTSGTTGEPKGVMLTQHNLVTNSTATTDEFEMSPNDRRLTFLPLSHIFARTCDFYTWIVAGYELALATSRETVIAECAEFHPTLLNGVPYFYDKVRRTLIDAGRDNEPGALCELLGGNIRVCCSGGAALPDHVFDFFWERGVPMLQGYGLTETSPVITMSTLEKYRRGASGCVIRDVEVRIAEDGEIMSRGPHIMVGYYQQPEATAEVMQDGWFRTGDLGRMDSDGFIFITGRKKEILVTSGGKNISPVNLEALLTEDPLILQAVVFGDGRDYLTALIVPNPDMLRDEIIARGIQVLSREQALTHPDVLALYEARIRERLRNVSYYEQVRKFRLMNRGFTIDSGELTPKLSLRRKQIEANCCAMIEEMYRK